MRRKKILFVLLGAFSFVLGACGDSNHIKESYGTFEYEMYGTYDLKYETLTIYNVEFNKTSDE